jgi:surface protein
MAFMFEYCRELESLDLRSFNTALVEDFGQMFNGCVKMRSLLFDTAKFSTANATVLGSMFMECNALESLDVSKFNTSKCDYIIQMFYGCKSLTELDVSNFDLSEATDMQNMFGNCEKLKKIDVSHFNAQKVKYMDRLFYGCSSLESIDMHSFKTDKVWSMMGMFYGCKSLKTIDLGHFNTPSLSACSEMFAHCTNLTTINIANFKPGQWFQQTFDMFRDCPNLTTIYCDNDLVEGMDLNYGNPGDIVGNMFLGCTKLKGGNGTTYIENPSKLDIYYAHPDAAGNPGYFTLTPTAINATKVDATNASQQFYSLDGRTGKTRGLNIVRTQSKRPRKVLFK